MSCNEDKFFNFIVTQKEYSPLEQAKIRFGISIIKSEFSKLILVYGFAYIFNCLLATLTIHLTFYLLRQVSFGYHFQSAIKCIALSILFFPCAALILSKLYVVTWLIHIIFIISIFGISFYGPAETIKHPIINERHRQYLKKKINIRLCIVIVLVVLLPKNIIIFITYAVLIQCLAILYQTYKEENLKC